MNYSMSLAMSVFTETFIEFKCKHEHIFLLACSRQNRYHVPTTKFWQKIFNFILPDTCNKAFQGIVCIVCNLSCIKFYNSNHKLELNKNSDLVLEHSPKKDVL